MIRFLIFVISCFLISCRGDERKQIQLNLLNTTDYPVEVLLDARPDYRRHDLYKTSDRGGGMLETRFTILPRENYNLFTSADLSQQPSELLDKVFYNIRLTALSGDGNIRKVLLGSEKSEGYTINPFLDDGAWKYEHKTLRLDRQFSSVTIESHEYTFLLEEAGFSSD